MSEDALPREARVGIRPDIESLPPKIQNGDAAETTPGIEKLLTVQSLDVSYGGVHAISNVTFETDRTGVCGLIGPNGAGKTTFLDVLAGLRSPTSGTILFDGADISRKSSTWRARAGVGRTFQRQQPFSRLTVEENIFVALEWKGRMRRIGSDLLQTPSSKRRTADVRNQADSLLDQYGLTDVATIPAAHLTIGRMRMLEFVRAIASQPRLLLLDEPTSGLSHVESDLLAEAIKKISGDCAVILVEHDLSFVLRNCDRVVLLNLGQIVVDEKAAKIQNNRSIISEYMGAFGGIDDVMDSTDFGT